MTAEFKNYLKRFINPTFAVSATFYFIKALFRKITRISQGVISKESMTDDVQQLRERFLRSNNENLSINEPKFDKIYNIRLAIGEMKIQSSKDWQHRFEDAEMNVSKDRWGWLLTGVNGEALPFDPDEGLLLIRSWASQFINDRELVKDAYSTGERISNAVLFFKLHNTPFPDDIKRIIEKLAYQVAENIEYLPAGLTGNHAFNNARALYFAAKVIDCAILHKIAISISRERLSALLTKDGFMREGSSHYHFLFTRWVLEMIWFARITNDIEALNLFTPCAEKLLQRCWFFLVQNKKDLSWSLPLIGDISPDCQPKWLMTLPWTPISCSIFKPAILPYPPEESGWAELFGGLEDFSKNVLTQLDFSSSCGWHRIEGFNWTIITYAPDKYGMLEATHSHQDLCSFVAYYEGRPILVDPGRLDYTNSYVSRYGKSAESHNTLLIDGIEPVVDFIGWMFPDYGKLSVNLMIDRNLEAVKIKIGHNGFKRIAFNNISHEREIILSSNSLEVVDNINGAGLHSIRLLFQFGPDSSFQNLSAHTWVDSTKQTCIITSNNTNVTCITESSALDYGWIFPSYGLKAPSLSMKLENLLVLPTQIRNKITLGN